MMATVEQAEARAYKSVVEEPTFPSGLYAVQSQLQHHGHDPNEGLLRWRPRPGEHCLRTEDLEALIDREGSRIALVLLSGVNFFTGQWFDLERITATAKRYGCVASWDLAHSAVNVVLHLHDWQVHLRGW